MSSPSLTPIKVGFIGLSKHGWASYALAPSITHSPTLRETFKLKAVSTTSQASAQETASKWAEVVGHVIEPYYTGDATRTIAKDSNLDMVLVAVNTMRQRSALLPIIEAGKDFFVEWPAGRGLSETLEIADAAKKYGVRTMVGLQGRESFVIRKVRIEPRARHCLAHLYTGQGAHQGSCNRQDFVHQHREFKLNCSRPK
jgi:predicted dehydrogenase